MHSSLISKIQKANLYAHEPERVRFGDLSVTFRGDNDTHQVSYTTGNWHCNCQFFPIWRTCSHVMAMQKLVGTMLPREATYFPATETAAASS
jgi:hypothetical protein